MVILRLLIQDSRPSLYADLEGNQSRTRTVAGAAAERGDW
jgi:hypothetical protein